VARERRSGEERRAAVDRRGKVYLTRRFALALAMITMGYTTFVFYVADQAGDRAEQEAKNRAAAIAAESAERSRALAAEAAERAREAAKRLDQSCTLQERRYQSEVRQLLATYDYVARPESKDDELYPLILEQLPAAERDTKLAHPPKYCAAKGVGVPHSRIPGVPDRPKAVQELFPK
jgi:hypothetical protein